MAAPSPPKPAPTMAMSVSWAVTALIIADGDDRGAASRATRGALLRRGSLRAVGRLPAVLPAAEAGGGSGDPREPDRLVAAGGGPGARRDAQLRIGVERRARSPQARAPRDRGSADRRELGHVHLRGQLRPRDR